MHTVSINDVCAEKLYNNLKSDRCLSAVGNLNTCRSDHKLTSEVVSGVWRQARVLVLPAVVPGGRALPGTLGLHLDHQGNPLLLVSCL